MGSNPAEVKRTTSSRSGKGKFILHQKKSKVNYFTPQALLKPAFVPPGGLAGLLACWPRATRAGEGRALGGALAQIALAIPFPPRVAQGQRPRIEGQRDVAGDSPGPPRTP